MLLVNVGGMVFDGSDEFRPGIEEASDSGDVLCEELDVCWLTEESWGRLITESFNGGGTGITGKNNSLIFAWLSM